MTRGDTIMKKTLSRVLALLCALMLALTMLLPAFAAEGEGDAAEEPPASSEGGGETAEDPPASEEGGDEEDPPVNTEPPYTITLDCQGGTTTQGGAAVSTATKRTDTSGRLTTLPTPVRSGYVFLGWFRQPTAAADVWGVTENDIFTEDTTLYAHWRQGSGSSGTPGGTDPDDPDKPSDPDNPDDPDETDPPTVPTVPEKPDVPTTPGGIAGPPTYVPPTQAAPSRAELNSQNWDVVSSEGNGSFGFVYIRPNGMRAAGSCYLTLADGTGHRYLFDRWGILQNGAQMANAQTGIRTSQEGDVLMNGNLYYLNPNRNINDPRTCYVMTDYLRVRPNYAGQTYYDKDGITFEGWIKMPDGGLRYQTRIPQPGRMNDLYLIVWRLQMLPACQHPDHPGDARYTMPAGLYFFDDNGVLVQREGWHDGHDGREYYTNANGQVVQQRVKTA